MARNKQSFGPTVINGFVRRTSVSALSAFDPETYAGCPRRWWFTRVAGVNEPETSAQKAGTDGHGEAEHYLLTNEDVLSPMMRAGKHLMPRPGDDLIIEAPFGDLGTAIALREKSASPAEIEKAAGLVAGSIPLDGFIDVRHARGEYVDPAGIVQRERPEHGKVIEVVDHKTTSVIDKFAKSPEEMSSSIQMVGYANYVINTIPDVDHVRLSHIYYQSRGRHAAKKVTSLVSVRKAREGWKRIHQLASYMEEVARAARVEDIEPSLAACDAYRGCPHESHCPTTRKLGTGGNSMASLFGNISVNSQTTNGASKPATSAPSASLFGSKPNEAAKPVVATAPTAPVIDRGAVDAEKARLAAEDAEHAAPAKITVPTGMGGKIPVTSCEADKDYFVDCADGSKPRRMKFAGSSKGFYFFADASGGRVRLEVADDVWESVSGAGMAVSPPSAPQATMLTSAAPLSAERIQTIEDPEIRQRAEQHAKAHAEQVAAQPAVTEKVSGRCPQGGRQIILSTDNLAMQTAACRCGKEWKLKTLEPKKTDDTWTVMLPAHNVPKQKEGSTDVTAAPAPVPTPVPAPAPTVEAPPAQAIQKPAASSAANMLTTLWANMPLEGIVLYVDIMSERGTLKLIPLDTYYMPLVRELEEQHGAADIRCAPQDSPLGYSKWKGALAAFVRSRPPQPGSYSVQSSSEVAKVVIEELSPMCTAVLRPIYQ